jgi:hypothetical protein
MVDAMCRNQGSGGAQHKNLLQCHHDDAKLENFVFRSRLSLLVKKGQGRPSNYISLVSTARSSCIFPPRAELERYVRDDGKGQRSRDRLSSILW